MPSNENLQQLIPYFVKSNAYFTKTSKCILRTVDKNISHHFLQTPHFFLFLRPGAGRGKVCGERTRAESGMGISGMGKGWDVGWDKWDGEKGDGERAGW